MACVCHIKACHSVYDSEHKVYAADYDDGLYGQGCQIIHAYVGNVAQYQRQYQFADRCEGGAEQIHYHDSYVVPVIGDKSFKQCTCFHIVYVYILYVYSFHSARFKCPDAYGGVFDCLQRHVPFFSVSQILYFFHKKNMAVQAMLFLLF